MSFRSAPQNQFATVSALADRPQIQCPLCARSCRSLSTFNHGAEGSSPPRSLWKIRRLGTHFPALASIRESTVWTFSRSANVLNCPVCSQAEGGIVPFPSRRRLVALLPGSLRERKEFHGTELRLPSLVGVILQKPLANPARAAAQLPIAPSPYPSGLFRLAISSREPRPRPG
jgi:hypothetical protein